MNKPGVDRGDLLVRSRAALLDVLCALDEHLDAVVVIGAQAVYLHTGGVDVALAEATKDSDVAVDPRRLSDDPRIEAAMTLAGFMPSANRQPGAWVNADGIPVDLMVPELLAGGGGNHARAARIPPHDKRCARRAKGLEAAIVDRTLMPIRTLDPSDQRVVHAYVAGPAALLVAKLHKIAERVGSPDRLNDKDAHDIYRILRAIDTAPLGAAMNVLLAEEISREVTRDALCHLNDYFAAAPTATGSVMAGRAEDGIGDPEQVSAAVSILASDLLDGLARQ